MKLSSVLGFVFCFGLTACGGGSDTLNGEQTGLFVGVDEYDQNDALRRLGENRSDEKILDAECTRLKTLSNSGILKRIDVLKLENDGTTRAVYYSEFGLFDPTKEPLEADRNSSILGRIVVDNGVRRFENSQPAFGKKSISSPDTDQVITASSSIQRTKVSFDYSSESDTTNIVNFTTDTVGSFGVEDRASFEFRKVDELELGEMMFTIQRYCLLN